MPHPREYFETIEADWISDGRPWCHDHRQYESVSPHPQFGPRDYGCLKCGQVWNEGDGRPEARGTLRR